MLGDIHRAHKNPGIHTFFGIPGVSLETPGIPGVCMSLDNVFYNF